MKNIHGSETLALPAFKVLPACFNPESSELNRVIDARFHGNDDFLQGHHEKK